MRGKNIAWLPLIVLFLGLVLVRPGSAPRAHSTTTISVEPSVVRGIPGDSFEVDITVTDVVDLYTYGFELHYEPTVRILAAVTVVEGDFLGPITGEPEFSVEMLPLEGIVKVGDTLKGNVSGYSGSGVLATIRFKVWEAGECPLTLHNTRLLNSAMDGALAEIAHDVVGAFYEGPTCTLNRAKAYGGWFWFLGLPGDIAAFHAKVENPGTGREPVNLWAQVKFDLTRRGDGRVSTFWSGQRYKTTPPPPEYLYVDGFSEWFAEWTTVGTSPWLDAPDDGNYITSSIDAAFMCWFTFENITLGDRVIRYVILEAYTDGPYNVGIDYDAYANNFAWLGSLYANGHPAWVTPRWLDPSETVDSIYPPVLTEEGINSFHMGLYFYDPGHTALGNDMVDCLRLQVVFLATYPVYPIPTFLIAHGEKVWLDPARWILAEEDVGFYTGTATLYFSYYGERYSEAERICRVWLWVLPPWP